MTLRQYLACRECGKVAQHYTTVTTPISCTKLNVFISVITVNHRPLSFGAFTIVEIRLLASPYLYVFLSVRMKNPENSWIDLYEIWYWKVLLKCCDTFKFWLKSDHNWHFTWVRACASGTDCVGNPSHNESPPWWRNHPTRQTPDPPPTKNSLTTDNSDVTGAIRKGQTSNSDESARTVRLCVHFLTYLNNSTCVQVTFKCLSIGRVLLCSIIFFFPTP
jgi:hypothetical protein